MVDTVVANVRILNAAGTLVLDLASTGFVVRSISALNREWSSFDVRTPFADGEDNLNPTLTAQDYTVQVGLEGGSWVVVEQKYAALLAAVEQFSWLLEVTTSTVVTTWRVRKPANTAFPGPDSAAIGTFKWTGSFTARVQPTPTRTGI